MKGTFVVRSDLTALHVWGDSEDPTNPAEWFGFLATNSRSLATDFKTETAAEEAIKRHNLQNCVVVTFK